MLAPGVKARDTADCETPASRATSKDVAPSRPGFIALSPMAQGDHRSERFAAVLNTVASAYFLVY
jgi:hypothetical protein